MPTSPALRIARVLSLLQVIVAGAGVVLALGVAVLARHDDLAAQRSGHPNAFAGLGVFVALFFAVVLGLLASVLLVGVIGMFRGRQWGCIVTIVGEALSLVPMLHVVPSLTYGGASVIVLAAAAIAIAVIVLASVAMSAQPAQSHA